MSDTKAKWKKDLLTVENSDLIRAARKKAPRDLLEIAPFMVFIEINYSGVALNPKLQINLVGAAQDQADIIQKKLVGELNKLIDDLLVLRKQDEQGNAKAGESAEKRVKEVSDHVEEALYDFGHDVRKGLEKIVKLPSGIKTIGRGHFRGIKLVYSFRGGAKGAFTEAYEEQAKEFDKAADEALTLARQEEDQRETCLRSLEDARKSAHEQTEQAAKELQQAQHKLTKAIQVRNAAKEKEAREKAVDAVESAQEEVDKLLAGQPTAWAKFVIQEARSLQGQVQSWANVLQEYKKHLDACDKEALKALNKLKKDAEDKEKKAVEKVMTELHKLSHMVSSRQATVVYMLGEYKKLGASAAKPEDWGKRLERDISTIKTMKDSNAQEFDKASREMVGVAGKMG